MEQPTEQSTLKLLYMNETILTPEVKLIYTLRTPAPPLAAVHTLKFRSGINVLCILLPKASRQSTLKINSFDHLSHPRVRMCASFVRT